jgi:hypothetical protein
MYGRGVFSKSVNSDSIMIVVPLYGSEFYRVFKELAAESEGCETPMKGRDKPRKTQGDPMKGYRYWDLAPETGIEEDYIPIVFLYL